jgi:alpha-1,2-glucosyltransferase
MLYIWPLFAFFSAPIFAPVVYAHFGNIFAWLLPHRSRGTARKGAKPGVTHKRATTEKSRALQILESVFQMNLLWVALCSATCLAASFLVVRFNTIIHPFTLADNRHYMFYIFRYSIRRNEWIRFTLVPFYTLSGWLCFEALRGGYHHSLYSQDAEDTAPNHQPRGSDPDCIGEMVCQSDEMFINTPFASKEMRYLMDKVGGERQKTAPAIDKEQEPQTLNQPHATSGYPPYTSTVLLWLLTSALSLITAPLVEPRYFILPWVFWRLLIPSWPTHDGSLSSSNRSGSNHDSIWAQRLKIGQKYDLRLIIETGWFVAINLATMYVFLAKPFYWRAADGTVMDQGKQQRFMW